MLGRRRLLAALAVLLAIAAAVGATAEEKAVDQKAEPFAGSITQGCDKCEMEEGEDDVIVPSFSNEDLKRWAKHTTERAKNIMETLELLRQKQSEKKDPVEQNIKSSKHLLRIYGKLRDKLLEVLGKNPSFNVDRLPSRNKIFVDASGQHWENADMKDDVVHLMNEFRLDAEADKEARKRAKLRKDVMFLHDLNKNGTSDNSSNTQVVATIVDSLPGKCACTCPQMTCPCSCPSVAFRDDDQFVYALGQNGRPLARVHQITATTFTTTGGVLRRRRKPAPRPVQRVPVPRPVYNPYPSGRDDDCKPPLCYESPPESFNAGASASLPSPPANAAKAQDSLPQVNPAMRRKMKFGAYKGGSNMFSAPPPRTAAQRSNLQRVPTVPSLRGT